MSRICCQPHGPPASGALSVQRGLRGLSWDVMFCHGPHTDSAYAMVVSVITLSSRPREGSGEGPLNRAPGGREGFPAEIGPRFDLRSSSFHPAAPALHLRHRCFLSVQFRSVLPAAGLPGQRTLFRAYRACARPRPSAGALRGGAVRAPDCACAREPKRRAHVSRQFPAGFFRTGAKRERRRPRADTASFLPPNLAIERSGVNPSGELFQTT